MIRFRRIVCLLMLLMTMRAAAQVLDMQETQGLVHKGLKAEDWGDKQVKLSHNDSIDGNSGI